MREKRSMYQRIFGKKNIDHINATQLQMLNGFNATFNTFSGDSYDSDVVRSVIDSIARNGAKLTPKHMFDKKTTTSKPTDVEKLLKYQPNQYMDAYSFFYKIITALYVKNNAFIFIDKDKFGTAKAFYPVDSSSVEFVEAELEGQTEIFARFRFLGGKEVTLPYSDLIHLRRFFYKNDLYGETSDKALNPTLQLIQTTDDGIANAVQSSAYLRGLLVFEGQIRPEDLKTQADEFKKSFMSISNSGGVAATDAKAKFQELNNDPKMVDGEQMKLIQEKVYKYYGINENIVKSDYTEQQFNSFYESILEPLAIQLSLTFTNALFTRKEKDAGHHIVFSTDRIQYASTQTKLKMVEILTDRGLLTDNEAREIFNMSPLPNGDRKIVSLNYIDKDLASNYQMGRAHIKDNSNGKESDETDDD
ncbi:phage portal protein [Salipaludibacillus sp. CF4.18]|uniref:phage portal protein n=1 Tax=Salipaludibacillus sp. CF4.18 TaxID=3373081 RepID=UPI003EE59254